MSRGIEIRANNITDVENLLAGQLRSQQPDTIKYALVNIIYWGYAKIGYRQNRIDAFMDNVSSFQIQAFQTLTSTNKIPTLRAIKEIGLPQYSGMSFITKILMFLKPNDYCVLDQQIAKLRDPASNKVLNDLVFGKKDAQIRISKHNEAVYDGWCHECLEISLKYFRGIYRVVDIERGFFNLIQQNRLLDAREIYNDA